MITFQRKEFSPGRRDSVGWKILFVFEAKRLRQGQRVAQVQKLQPCPPGRQDTQR